LGIWLHLPAAQWALVVVTITLVFAGEMLNTVVERLVDLHSPNLHPLAGQAKDVSAGAVLLSAVAAVVSGCWS
jgi:diacylglycerol kinase